VPRTKKGQSIDVPRVQSLNRSDAIVVGIGTAWLAVLCCVVGLMLCRQQRRVPRCVLSTLARAACPTCSSISWCGEGIERPTYGWGGGARHASSPRPSPAVRGPVGRLLGPTCLGGGAWVTTIM
jgi:hypothetical protein